MMIRLSSYVSVTALAGVCAACVFATAVAAEDRTTDIGTLDKETADKAFPTKPPYSPYAGRNFPTRPYFGDTHTHTPLSRWTRVRSALGSVQRTPIALVRARKLSPLADNAPNFRVPWTSWW